MKYLTISSAAVRTCRAMRVHAGCGLTGGWPFRRIGVFCLPHTFEIIQTYCPILFHYRHPNRKRNKFPDSKARNTPCYSVGSVDCGVLVFGVLEAEQQCHLVIHQDHTSAPVQDCVFANLAGHEIPVPILGALDRVPDHTRGFVLYEYELPSATCAAPRNCHVDCRLPAGARHVTLGLYRNQSVERMKGNQDTFDNSQRNNLRSCVYVRW